MKKYLTLLAGAMFLTACYNDAEDIAGKDGYQPSTDAIAFEFNGDEVENATRASGAIYNDVALQAEKIGIQGGKGIGEALAGRSSQAVHVPGNEFHRFFTMFRMTGN